MYELTLAASEPIAGLVPLAEQPARIDCTIHLRELPDVDATDVILANDAVTIARANDAYRFDYRDGTRFVIARDGGAIWCTWESTPEDAATYLLGPILAFVLRLRGSLALHASAVIIDGRALVFAAPPGGGKSTLAAAFARDGYAVLSDDVVRLEPEATRVVAFPGYPLVRLWGDVAAEFYGAADALPQLTPTWPKRYLDLRDGPFHNAPASVAAIYVLAARGAETVIEPLGGATAALALIANSSMNVALDGEQRIRELDLVAKTVELVPVRRLQGLDSLGSISALCHRLVESSQPTP